MICHKRKLKTRTAVHGAHHARDEAVDAPAFLNQRYKGRNATFVVRRVAEVGKDHLLERVNHVLQAHKVGNRLIAEEE